MTDYSDVGLDAHSNVKVFVRLRPPDAASVAAAAAAAASAPVVGPGATAGAGAGAGGHKELSLERAFERDTEPSSRCVHPYFTFQGSLSVGPLATHHCPLVGCEAFMKSVTALGWR